MRAGVPRAALALIVAGALLGPIYNLYCERLSGQLAASFDLSERAAKWPLPDGAIRTFEGGTQAYRPVVLKLGPEMNRIRLKLKIAAAPAAPGTPVARSPHRAEVLEGTRAIFKRSLPIMLLPGEQYELTIGALEVELPGEYVFLLSEESPPRVTVSKVTLDVYERYVRPLPPILWLGRTALLAGVVWLLATLCRGQQREAD
jgi:hypothetical protein